MAKKLKKKINKVIKILILSDIALLTGYGLVLPVFAIFIAGNIKGGNVEVAGFAAAIYWIVKSIVIIPFGRYLDKNHGERDDLAFIIIGNLLAAASVFGYLFVTLPWHIYLLQAVFAVGMGMNIPGYTAIFTRHIDKGKEAFEWSVRGAATAVGTGVAGAIGGIIAHNFGFQSLFIAVGLFYIFSALLPFLITAEMSAQNIEAPKIPGQKSTHISQPKD